MATTTLNRTRSWLGSLPRRTKFKGGKSQKRHEESAVSPSATLDAPAQGEQRRWSRLVPGPAVTIAVLASIEAVSRAVGRVPNPGVYFLPAVAFSAYVGGVAAGLVSAALALAYAAYFFAEPGRVFHYAGGDRARFVGMLVAAPVVALLVGLMRRRVEAAAARTIQTERAHSASLAALLEERDRSAAERAKLMATVEREHAVMAAVMAGMSDGLVVVDGQDRIRYCNAQAAKLLQLDAESITGQTLQVAFVSVGRRLVNLEVARETWRRAREHLGERPSVELQLRTEAGMRYVLLDIFPIDDVEHGDERVDTQAREVGVLLRDVTAERELARTKDEFTSMVSHEIRAPLASILGFAELMALRLLPPEQMQSSAETIHRESMRLSALIDDVLDIQRMEAGRMELHVSSVMVDLLVDEVVDLFRVQSAHHRLVANVPDDLPSVRGDRDRLKQVLSNLVSNAIKYSPDGGEVRICAEQVGDLVRLSVSDQGLGIPASALPQLFQRFYRVPGDDRNHIQGPGLGLAISRAIVEMHGGVLDVRSEVGRGSTFSFTLPLADMALDEDAA